MAMTAPIARVREVVMTRSWPRLVGGALLLVLLVPLLLSAFAPAASAETCAGDDASDDCKDYSLYTLASNASSYFSNSLSPDATNEDSDAAIDHDKWDEVTQSPGRAGSVIGYSDPSFSFSFKWLFAEVSGSSQTIEYSSFQTNDDENLTSGVVDYAHYGAALNDLGFDTTSGSGDIISVIIHGVGGFLMLVFYCLAIGIGWIMTGFIKLLKLLNPFSWFYYGVDAISPTWASGMVNGDTDLGAFDGLANFISGWYSTLHDLAATVLIPLFLAAFIAGALLFKKMNKGSAAKKLIIRVIFIFVGLPLIGSMYTQVLDKMDTGDSQSAGASQVVLSTYVDFNAWAMNERLAIPEKATIGWDAGEGRTTSQSTMNARTSALAINSIANPAFKGMGPATGGTGDAADWSDSSPNLSTTCGEDQDPKVDNCEEADSGSEVGSVMGLLGRYMKSQSVTASDFESGVKDQVAKASGIKDSQKREMFGDGSDDYDDANGFGAGGADGNVKPFDPIDHPIISTGVKGLTSDNPGASRKTFSTSEDVQDDCGFGIADEDGGPLNCNMSPLSTFNYLNTSFDSDSLTTYSSNKAMSDISRETHHAVNQIGTGPMSFAYWFNAIIILVCVVLLGLFYAFGMLFGAIKRTFMLVSAIPFASLGAISGIAKVIIYTVALITEVIATLFIYNFVSQVLIALPSIIEGPIAGFMKWEPMETALSSDTTGMVGTLIVLFTVLISTILVLVATIAMLKVRSSVVKAINEAVTKMVDKFLDTETAPKSDSGLLPAMAGGAGMGAGMALGNHMLGGKGGGSSSAPRKGEKDTSSSNSAPTNTGGGNGSLDSSGKVAGELEGGDSQEGGDGQLEGGPDGPSDQGGPDGRALSASAGGEGNGMNGQNGDSQALAGGTDGGSGHGGNGQGGVDGENGDAESAESRDGTVSTDNADDSAPLAVGSDGTVSTTTDDQRLANEVNAAGGLSGSTPGALAGQSGSGLQPSSTNLGGTNASSVDAQGDSPQTVNGSSSGGDTTGRPMGQAGTAPQAPSNVGQGSNSNSNAGTGTGSTGTNGNPAGTSNAGSPAPTPGIIPAVAPAAAPTKGQSAPTPSQAPTTPAAPNRQPAASQPPVNVTVNAPTSSTVPQATNSQAAVPIVVRGNPGPQATQPAAPAASPAAPGSSNTTNNSHTANTNHTTIINNGKGDSNIQLPRRGRRDKRD